MTEARARRPRARPASQDQADAENAVTAGPRQLLAVAENYPDLKANQNFLALQEELTGTESKIAYARQFYNDQVRAAEHGDPDVPLEHPRVDVPLHRRASSSTSRDAARGPVQVDLSRS